MTTALAHEASAANGAKEKTPFTVVVGNPPYSQESRAIKEISHGAWSNRLKTRSVMREINNPWRMITSNFCRWGFTFLKRSITLSYV